MTTQAQKAALIASAAAVKSLADALTADAPVPAPPAPSPSPTPTPAPSPYRYARPYLFQTVRAIAEPSRIAGGSPLAYDSSAPVYGPNRVYVDPLSGWAWDRPGGDWIDSAGTRWGLLSLASAPLNSALGSTAVFTYSVDFTKAVQAVQAANRWCAFLLRCSSAAVYRDVTTRFHPTLPAPKISVIYTDGTAAVLQNRIVAGTGSSALPNTTAPTITMPVLTEFDRPSKAVQSATLTLPVTAHWSGSTGLQAFPLDPPVNTDPVQLGIANAAPLDAGLAGHPSVIHVHRYIDGSAFADFVSPLKLNTDDEASFSPILYNATAPSDPQLLPNKDLGKFIGGDPANWRLMRSDHVGDGFVPLAPGIGAMRVEMPVEAPADGAIVGYSGTGAANAFIYLPESQFGLKKRLCVRHYVRIVPLAGDPYRMPIAKKFQVLHAANTAPLWTDTGGKWGITPDHMCYPDGGNSGASGGGFGFQMRFGWADCWADETGPDVGGVGCSLHTYDFGANNPEGFRYASIDTPKDSGFGQRGGLGSIIYAGRWYCMEIDMLLNDVMTAAPGYVPNGEVRIWVDGRLALQRVGMVFRSLPAYIRVNGVPTTPPFKRAGANRPVREIGFKGAWFNWFHGGLTKNSIPRALDISGVVLSDAYVGPMRLA